MTGLSGVSAAMPTYTSDLAILGLLVSILVTVATVMRAWWAPLLLLVVLLSAGMLTVDGTPLVRWMWHRSRFRHRQRCKFPLVPDPVDVETSGTITGVRWDQTGLIAMISVEVPEAFTVTAFAESGAIDNDNVLDLELLGQWLRFGDVVVEIDVTAAGQVWPRVGNQLADYQRTLSRLPTVSTRATWLTVRLDPLANLNAISRRGSAPKTLAAASVRIATRLRRHGIPAFPLTTEQILRHEQYLAPPQAEEFWDHSRSGDLVVTSYAAEPSKLTDDTCSRWWTATADYTATVIRLTAAEKGRVHVGALVRYVTTEPLREAPAEGLVRLPGHQGPALASALPLSRSSALIPPSVGLDTIAVRRVLIGPTGQLIGTTADGRSAIALPLVNSDDGSRKVVAVQSGPLLAEQLVLRAMASGARIRMHTSNPARWRNLTRMSNGRLWLAEQGSTTSDDDAQIAVFDHTPLPQKVADHPPTLIVLTDAGAPPVEHADVRITQPDPDHNSFVLTTGKRSLRLCMVTMDSEKESLPGAAVRPWQALDTDPVEDRFALLPARHTAVAPVDPRSREAPTPGGKHRTPPWLRTGASPGGAPMGAGWAPPRQIPHNDATDIRADAVADAVADARRPEPASSFDQARQRAADRIRREQLATTRSNSDHHDPDDAEGGWRHSGEEREIRHHS